MKRNRRVEMVLGMVRHVPHQKTDGPGSQRRTRIGEAISVFAAVSMFCQEDSAQYRLAEQRWDQPVKEWCCTPASYRTNRDKRVEPYLCPHGPDQLVPGRLWHKGEMGQTACRDHIHILY